jgi:hypothetical protein
LADGLIVGSGSALAAINLILNLTANKNCRSANAFRANPSALSLSKDAIAGKD